MTHITFAELGELFQGNRLKFYFALMSRGLDPTIELEREVYLENDTLLLHTDIPNRVFCGPNAHRIMTGIIDRWQPFEHVTIYGQSVAMPAACRCDRRLNQPHNEPTCPYAAPEVFYAGQVAMAAERAPA